MQHLNNVPLKRNLVPASKYHIKCPHPMVAKMITFHNTDNEVSAANEIAYMVRNNLQVSYHFAADEKEVVQGLPLDRNGWHCGDGGNGYGNRNTIGWEICRNYDRTRRTTNLIDPLKYMYTQAELNTIKAAAPVFEQLGIVATVNTVKKHQDWSGKNCPSKILNEMRWKAFQAAVIHEYNKYMNRGAVSGTVHEVKAGDTLSAIAAAYKTSVEALVKENGIKNANVISIGQLITVPIESEKAAPIVLPKKTIEQVANEIVNVTGDWGNGQTRIDRLTAAGFNASVVQQRVNEIIEEMNVPKKSNEDIALEIIDGTVNWGNGAERRTKLAAAGHDAGAVQRIVDRIWNERQKINKGDRVQVSRLYVNAYAINPSRRTPINGYVEHVDLNNNWRHKYRLEKTRGRKDWLGYADEADLKKL